MDVLCMTWNVNQQKPDARSAFFGIVNRLSRAEDIKVRCLVWLWTKASRSIY